MDFSKNLQEYLDQRIGLKRSLRELRLELKHYGLDSDSIDEVIRDILERLTKQTKE